MKKVIDGILTVLFLLFALVQINDPDPYLWIAIYGMVALIAGLAFLGKYHFWITAVLTLIIAIWAVSLVPNLLEWLGSSNLSEVAGEMMADKPYIEGSREFGGLLIAGIVLAYYLIRSKK